MSGERDGAEHARMEPQPHGKAAHSVTPFVPTMQLINNTAFCRRTVQYSIAPYSRLCHVGGDQPHLQREPYIMICRGSALAATRACVPLWLAISNTKAGIARLLFESSVELNFTYEMVSKSDCGRTQCCKWLALPHSLL